MRGPDSGVLSGNGRPEGLRVLMVSDTVGGVWTYSIELCRAFGEQGVEVLLAAVGDSITPAQTSEVDRLKGATLLYKKAKLEWMEEPWDDVEKTVHWLQELEDGFRPDVIHLNQYCYTSTGFCSPTLVVAHSCVYSWYEAVREGRPGAEWDEYQRRIAAGMAGATAVTGISESLLDGLEKWYGSYRRLPAVGNGRNVEAIRPAPKQPYILTAGRVWDEAKNIAVLSEAARNVEWPIRVAGESVSPNGNASPDCSNLELLGQLSREEMSSAMEQASVYICPALYEPFGLAVLEAAAAGCALILADIPSLRANWEGAALFVPPRSERCWTNAVQQLVDDEIKLSRFGELARERAVSSRFSASSMAESYLKYYYNIISESGASRTAQFAL
ncbi:glycosyltransferase family 4 protein [Pelagicoccus sp. SDUM812002]|uniref:glycosyltransferase family 4 protein n=1 Tax=Pelagicoccus sp. SDUM812002 TaxID=3041266 RepID=UPI00280EBE8F|nr:glycosyltransferase family 4 protein [Pelagicoccus sp. SDUM812002]MDQ8184113.1 glycosyltransferase family 4 protein [Pelagicoccus sp. SDUM812002]